jgi:hypothetical protein
VQPAHEPEKARREPELRRKYRPDERPRASNRGEVVSEEDPPAHRMEIRPVVLRVRRRHPGIVERHDLGCDEGAVVAVGNHEDAHDGDDDVKGLHGRKFYVILAK